MTICYDILLYFEISCKNFECKETGMYHTRFFGARVGHPSELGPTFQVLGLCFGGLTDCPGAQQCRGWSARENQPLVRREVLQRKFHNQIIHVDTKHWRITYLCVRGKKLSRAKLQSISWYFREWKMCFMIKKHILLHVPPQSFIQQFSEPLCLNTVLVSY